MSAAFDKLARPVQKWIRSKGWRELRDIQARATQAILDGDGDVIIAASTAGGKTEAAFLPLISEVLDGPRSQGQGFDLLYIGPLKALITDQAARLEDICRDAILPVVPWHGDVSQSVKARALKTPGGTLMITPESLEALFIRRGLEIPRLFRGLRAVVIDELHSVLDTERGVQLRSLLARMELSIGHPVRRVGLSATLGDMGLAKAYLRPDSASEVTLIEGDSGESELRLQVRGYLSGGEGDDARSATDAVAEHLFANLRGTDNLVFAGSRQSVEIYADRLRDLCEREHMPQEFYPHHASLSREHRDFVERRLKDPGKPTTAVCTSTLELGIDIGDVTCVAQIGAPFSVAALRQRLGRSGRREGQPAILRQYAVETALSSDSSFVDRLRLGLVRAIAMIELLLEGWCEPPKPQALHLSTLVHQILSVIAERGGASASRLYAILCREGPFRAVSQAQFLDVLRSIGEANTALIEQADDGSLLLGRVGEKLVEHYGFYAVFKTPEEFRLICDGRELGTIPIENILAPGMLLIFSGRRWVVEKMHDREKAIVVKPAKAGTPPMFGGDPGDIHDRVIERMFDIFEGELIPSYLDKTASELLEEARRNFHMLGFGETSIVSIGPDSSILAIRVGTIRAVSLALALRGQGFEVEQHDGFLKVERKGDAPALCEALKRILDQEEPDLAAGAPNLMFEKFHHYLSQDLLELDARSCRLDLTGVVMTAERLMR
ncbi:DEAD/DEAH box helicase [Roseivivax sp. THAF30]|uniref:DEAD/DEAH box helicase n=1 Tax=Roseivivax sp. THAF30 TaxID=2587852 RepID=UPI001268D0F4|nr:DEAD/DEAH box helicase [Roseivivax sp. THAF30]QFT61958.1 putative ATP-dependent helicase Lhr [Roseivivax sp. THAF30]